MLKQMEFHESQASAAERFDMSTLWGELGLRRAPR
jgi:hypothetical protein